MKYVCIENNQVVSILGYEPNVPESITVVQITDDEYTSITSETHKFDVVSKRVVPVDPSVSAQKAQDQANGIEKEFLNSTDWKVLRHLRQKALGVPTSLTEAEYLELENQRNAAAARIV